MKNRLLALALLALAPAYATPIIVGTVSYHLLDHMTMEIDITGGFALDNSSAQIPLLNVTINGFANIGTVGSTTVTAATGYIGIPPTVTATISASSLNGQRYPDLVLLSNQVLLNSNTTLQNPAFGLNATTSLTANVGDAPPSSVPEPGAGGLLLVGLAMVGFGRWLK